MSRKAEGWWLPTTTVGVRRAVVLGLAVLLCAGGAHAQPSSSLESSVKATFLYKFGPFVEWPASAFDSPTSPFVLCIAGDDPFGPTLDQAVAGQHVGQHPVAIRRLGRVERDGPACHVLYLAGSRTQSPTQAMAAVQGAPVLTVTDENRGDGAHGIVHFVLQNGRVRFNIDARTAAQNGLTVSSKLLSLAVNVRPALEAKP